MFESGYLNFNKYQVIFRITIILYLIERLIKTKIDEWLTK